MHKKSQEAAAHLESVEREIEEEEQRTRHANPQNIKTSHSAQSRGGRPTDSKTSQREENSEDEAMRHQRGVAMKMCFPSTSEGFVPELINHSMHAMRHNYPKMS